LPGGLNHGCVNSGLSFVKNVLMHVKDLKCRLGTTGVFTITLSEDLAVNIFNHDTAVPGRADYHSHWYDFRSEIVAGKLCHFRYVNDADGFDVLAQQVSMEHKPAGAPFALRLRECPCETYVAGDSYEITAPEIHRVVADPGTVTLVTRLHKTSPNGYYVFKSLRSQRPAASAQQAASDQGLETAPEFAALALAKIEEEEKFSLNGRVKGSEYDKIPFLQFR
jgi:hypothetical protein